MISWLVLTSHIIPKIDLEFTRDSTEVNKDFRINLITIYGF